MTLTRADSRQHRASSTPRGARSPRDETGIPAELRRGVESLSGESLADVRVQYSSPLPRRYGAVGLAQGSEVHLESGHERHLPHELWHVVQQKQGRVRPSGDGASLVNSAPQLEREADRMGAMAMLSRPEDLQVPSAPPRSTAPSAIQLKTSIKYGGLKRFEYKAKTGDFEGYVGTGVDAHLDPDDPCRGSDTAGSNAFNDLFAALQDDKNNQTRWVRGHLLNHDLGGLAIYNNLFPITVAANGEHYHEVEKKVKHWVANGYQAHYRVEAFGGEDGTANGRFLCSAEITEAPTPDGKKDVGTVINKMIYSKSEKTESERQYRNKKNRTVSKYSSVAFLPDNQVARDDYGVTKVLSTWKHVSGGAWMNNFVQHGDEYFWRTGDTRKPFFKDDDEAEVNGAEFDEDAIAEHSGAQEG